MTDPLPDEGGAAQAPRLQGPAWMRPARASRARLATAALLLLMAVLGATGLLERGLHIGPGEVLQRHVVRYLDSSETMALEAFAGARAINAVVSVLKSADLSAVVASFAPLEFLQPIDDLAKQFSDVMLVSITSIFVQRLILMVSQAWALGLVLPVGCVLMALSMQLRRWSGWRERLASTGRTLVILALFARFVVLAAGWLGQGVTDRFLGSDLQTSLSRIGAATSNLHQVSAQLSQTTPGLVGAAPAPTVPAPPVSTTTPPAAPAPAAGPAPESMLEHFGATLRAAVSGAGAGIRKGIGFVTSAGHVLPSSTSVMAAVADLPQQILRAIEIFLVQTIIMPFAVALVFYALLRGVTRPAPLRLGPAPGERSELLAARA
jgi:hypothetical protein